jgi:serine/threonine protein phosphatase PrpC
MDFIRRLFGKKQEVSAPSPASSEVAPSAPEQEIVVTKETHPLPSIEQPSPPIHTRRLTPPKAYVTSSRRVKVGIASNIGGRSNNEDAALSLVTNIEIASNPPPIGIFLVADGMGGHQDGELASSIAVRTVTQFILNEVVTAQMEDRDMNRADQKTIPEVLVEAMSAANSAVQAQVPGGGTTTTCAVIRGDLVYVAHVGDSRAYLIADGNLEQITRDHLLVRRLQELGQLTAQEADVHPQRNVLYRAIGQSDTLEVDAATRRLPPSSRLLLCSDGLWGVIGDNLITEIVTGCSDPQEACDQLVAAANDNNGPDNITAVLVQMPD